MNRQENGRPCPADIDHASGIRGFLSGSRILSQEFYAALVFFNFSGTSKNDIWLWMLKSEYGAIKHVFSGAVDCAEFCSITAQKNISEKSAVSSKRFPGSRYTAPKGIKKPGPKVRHKT
jgi:hypothetical protein